MKNFHHFTITTIAIAAMLVYSGITGCKKFIEIKAPNTSINQANVYTNNNNAISSITGIYTKMASSQFSLNLSVYPDLSADNLTLFDQDNQYAKLYYENALLANYPSSTTSIWNDLYGYIYYTNAAIEGLTQSTGLTESIKQRLLGEAYFLRGFYYFYLLNLFENVPLVISTDYSVSAVLPNSSSEKVYEQIISDLKKAEQILDNKYVDGTILQTTPERLRPNQNAASAMLARVYLYSGKFMDAEAEASKVINQSSLYTLSNINDVFLKNSSETIWSLQPVAENRNTMEGDFYIYTSDGPSNINFTYLSSDLLGAFEKGDLRKSSWVGEFIGTTQNYSYTHKYKVKDGNPGSPDEYTIVLRLSELYLIRAEARIQSGNISAGTEDLNAIRRRARAEPDTETPNPLPDLINLTKDQALNAVLKERRLEFFSEWGNRWFDLKRSGKIDQIMGIETPKKGGVWKSYQSTYPIPLTEVMGNPNLKQNPGYN